MANKLDIFNPFHSVSQEDFIVSDYRKAVLEFTKNAEQNPLQYQLIILAAGKGSRMKIDYPKIMYELPYPGRKSSILDNMLDGIRHLKTSVDISDTYLVVDRDSKHFFDSLTFEDDIEILALNKSQIRGTAVCISAIKELLDPSKQVIILWGDLALWRTCDLNIVLKIHEAAESSLTFATRIKHQPYVAFLRSDKGQPFSVIHSNEVERYQGTAEQDCLSFVCSHQSLSYIDELINLAPPFKEVDFIHYIPHLVSKGLKVLPIPIVETDTIFGLNTPKRAEEVSEFLSRYSSKEYSDFFLKT